MTDLADLGAREARRLIGNKEISPVALLESCIARTEAVNPVVNAMVATCYERARKEANAAERAVLVGDDLGLLHGLPVGVKDLQVTEGLRTTYGSLLYKDNVPEADERVIAAVRAEGGVVIGKTNTPEFGAGANTTNRVYGATGNPFDPELTSAGSSRGSDAWLMATVALGLVIEEFGGSAVAVATGMTPIATGSDFGGSLRTPAAFCGVCGYRPSPGVVPNESRPVGLTPLSVVGPMARNVGDMALLLAAMVDFDKCDPFSGFVDPDLLDLPRQVDLATVHLAISEDLGAAPVDDGIRKVFRERIAKMSSLFASVEDRKPDLGSVHEVFEILRGVNFVAAHRQRLQRHRQHRTRSEIQRRRGRLGPC